VKQFYNVAPLFLFYVIFYLREIEPSASNGRVLIALFYLKKYLDVISYLYEIYIIV